MTPDEIEATLRTAFQSCATQGCALSDSQMQILLEVVVAGLKSVHVPSMSHNPLDDLTPAERHALLTYIRTQRAEAEDWKVRLLNDWLQGRDSGAVQFIRDRWGIQWLDQIQPEHLNPYLEKEPLSLQVGDRIEVANSLWEWVPEYEAQNREWVLCTVVSLVPALETEVSRCTVRFENGMEYEIQGVYEWNRYHWRLPQ